MVILICLIALFLFTLFCLFTISSHQSNAEEIIEKGRLAERLKAPRC
jgi:hypothetical protein